MKFNAETIIKLLQVKGIGREKIFSLSELLPSPLNDDNSLADFVIENSIKIGIEPITKHQMLDLFLKGKDLFNESIDKNIRIVAYGDKNYPQALASTTSPPVILNIMGNLDSIISMPCIAVVGTREPSDFGRQTGEWIGYLLGERGVNVVSGLALGCDTAAHTGCLKAHGVTTAILAHGLDTIYPLENIRLAQSILDHNGCLVSEYLIKTPVSPNLLVKRNRIQVGLSKGSIVVETDITGGTMHAVRKTLDNKRMLAAFFHPYEKRNEKSRGNEMLIDKGKAVKIQNQEDIDALIQK